jgi:hypothetical protein
VSIAVSDQVVILLVPHRGPILRLTTTRTDYEAIDAWYRDPASAQVPVHIPNADDPTDVRTFLPDEIAEVSYVGPASSTDT